MITKEEFTKFITTYQNFEKNIDRLFYAFTGSKNNFMDCDWIDEVNKLLEATIHSHFTEAGSDWIFYYLYEPIKDKKVIITKSADLFDTEQKVEYHLNSIDELWEFLQTDIKTYFKNAS
jgi:hypothetical protein